MASPPPAFSPGESHGQEESGRLQSMVKESDTTERLSRSVQLPKQDLQEIGEIAMMLTSMFGLISISGNVLLFYETDRDEKEKKNQD